MTIPVLPEAQNVLVVGPVASGKTFLLDKWWESAPRVLLFDGTGEIADNDPRLAHLHTRWQLGEYLREVRRDTRWRAVFHAGETVEEKINPRDLSSLEFNFLYALRNVWQLDMARHLFVDEVQQISHLDETDTALRFARKRLLGIVGATQRLADTTTTYRANARMVILFFTHEGNDLDAIRESWGTEVQEAVTQLRPLIYDDVTKNVVQTPQALVYRRGMPPEVVELG